MSSLAQNANAEAAAASESASQGSESEARSYTQAELDERLGAAKERGRLQALADVSRLSQTGGGDSPAPAAPAQSNPTPPSREQLRAAVDDGKITEDQMQSELDRQRDASIEQKINTRVEAATSTQNRARELNTQMDQWLELRPSIADRDSEDWLKVQREYRRLVDGHGLGENIGTEIIALEKCFGSVNRIAETTAADRESHRETGGGSAETASKNSGGAPSEMPAKLRTHYEGMIQKGMYSGWDDENLKKELSYT